MLRIGLILLALVLLAFALSLSLAAFYPDLGLPVLFALQILITGLLIYTFNRWLWRLAIWRWLGLIQRPDIHGHWNVTLISSYNENSVVDHAKAFIKQGWLTMNVRFQSKNAVSQSMSAIIYQEKGDVLAYIYRAQPLNTAPQEARPHIGLSVLRLMEDGRLSGYYHYFYYDAERLEFIRGQLIFSRS